ncbi:glycoside hydrolase family 28 protein [Mangrovibacterium marinum]|uniref:Glycosyl hydrolase family 28 n=1 Tax=Mangrovibacterium marinum TaxID=1639118 RepID=A0A2T5BXG9_9BACT|nr:glycosyl hydrolase family 28 protein [Mangrovibacterium marinum]PTN05296.1 glycosyl hydrolase family 28 [Mangrovibacterium marinum]
MNIFRKLLVLFLLMNFVYVSRGESKYIVTDFGAVPGGKVLNTKAIQKAIDLASANGGGVVIVPPGTFLTGCIQLKDHVELHLEKDAVLLGSTSPYDYFKVERELLPQSPKTDDNSELGLVLAVNAKNISLTGQGTIDGQGLALALAADSLHHAGILVDKNYNYRRMRPSELVRPKLFRFLQCEGITIKNLRLTNSANWGLSFDLCRNMVLDSLKITNRAYWNNDGMDITDCVNVRITNCNVDAADDGICLKSYHPGQANDSIYIANCTVRSSASAVKFGTGSYGGFKNVTIENINVFDTFRSAIAIESVDGAQIENIRVNNIVAENTGNAIFIRLGHRDGEKPGVVRNIHISNMNVQVPFGRPDIDYDLRGPEVDFFHNPFPASIVGIPGHSIENVVLENIEITYPGRASKGMAYIPLSDLDRVPEQVEKYPEFSMLGELPAWGFYVRHAREIQFKNINLKLEAPDYRPAFVFDDVQTVAIDKLELSGAGAHPQIVLKGVQDANMPIPENQIQTIQ